MLPDTDPEVAGRRALLRQIGFVVGLVVLMWVVEFVDTFALGDRLQGNGIVPRTSSGLDGILWAPFLHADWRHIFSNSAPFLFLSALVAIRGFGYWLRVTVVAWLLGGALTWIFAGTGNHIGASGVVFGYLGALLGAAIFERSVRAAAPAAVALFLYYAMLIGLVPQQGISWEGHLAGFLSGIAISRTMVRPRERRVDDELPIAGDYWME
ncbi:MAG: rhomboid family intramembrane serine protease [Acidimicrobiales bacterium]